MKTNLAIVITLALGITASEFDATVEQAREALGLSDDNSIAPTAVAAAQTAPTVEQLHDAGLVDINGLPWDKRIHSSSKGKNQDGTWRYLKGGDKTLRAKVEADLKSTIGASPATVTVAPVATIPLPGMIPLPLAAPPANPQFTAFVAFIAQNTKSDTNPTGRLTDEWVKATLLANGVAGGELQNLAANTALIGPIEAGIKAALGLVV